MIRRRNPFLFSTLTFFLGLSPALAGAASLSGALADGKAKADLRYRYEMNDTNDGTRDKASASTLRTRLGYRTGDFMDAALFVEFENVMVVDGDNYRVNPADPEPYDIVADPTGTEVNQAYLDYQGVFDTLIRAGRQRLKLDNDRHIGNVGWRQNEQTFDAAMIRNGSVEGLTSLFAYIWNTNGIKFDNTDHEAYLLNVKYTGLGVGALTGYGYWINNNDAPTESTRTFGLRYAGRFDAGEIPVLLNLEYAAQGEYADSAVDDTTYLLGELGATLSPVTALFGYEELGADGTSEFETPLATKHAFNGWADMFLNTPRVGADAGLTDMYLTVKGMLAGTKLMAVYHDFSAAEGSADWGTELDLLAAKKVAEGTKVGIKYATFNADNANYVDTDKLWVWLETAF